MRRRRKMLAEWIQAVSAAVVGHESRLDALERRVAELTRSDPGYYGVGGTAIVYYQCPQCGMTIRSDVTHICGVSNP